MHVDTRVVRDHFETVRAEAVILRDGKGCTASSSRVPGLQRCDWLAFARFRCATAVSGPAGPVSRKGRAVCPSYVGRRMVERGAPILSITSSPMCRCGHLTSRTSDRVYIVRRVTQFMAMTRTPFLSWDRWIDIDSPCILLTIRSSSVSTALVAAHPTPVMSPTRMRAPDPTSEHTLS